jgi:hypothetical protein
MTKILYSKQYKYWLFMKLLALWKFNLIPNLSPCRRRELKALSRKERVG